MPFSYLELEDLIRKILVKNPAQRYTLNQIKGHPWLQKEVPQRNPLQEFENININDLNPQVLHLMRSLSIDTEKTRKVKIYFGKKFFKLGFFSMFPFDISLKTSENFCFLMFLGGSKVSSQYFNFMPLENIRKHVISR